MKKYKKHSENGYELLLKNSLKGIAKHRIIFDKNKRPIDYVFLEVNSAFEKLTGLKRRDIINKRVTKIIPNIKETNLIKIYGGVVLTGKTIDFEQYIDPLEKFYHITAYKIEQDKFITLFEDVTDQKNTEERLKIFSIIIEQNPSLIMLTDKKGMIKYVNSKFSEITGYSFKEVKDKNPNILKSGKTSLQEYEAIWKTLTSGNVWKGEFYNKKKNNKYYWASSTIFPIKNEKGEITNFVGLQEDITLKKEIESVLKEKILEMEKFQGFASDRELRMIELKKEVNDLLKKQGNSTKYKT